jgi:signal peptidase I
VSEIEEVPSVVTKPKDAKKLIVAGKTAGKGKAGADSWIETGKTIVYALLIALVIRTFLFQPFYIPSGSMENTLLVGDYLFLEKFAFGYSRYSFPFGLPPFSGRIPAGGPQRGDVVVFKMPNPNSPDYMKDFIKRVMGLPGDRVQMVNGQVWLNGKPIPKVRAADYVEDDPYGGVNHVPRFKETLPGGKTYFVLDRIADGPSDNTPVYVVPPGHYFMMGDNRDNSDDSRADVGFVPADNIEGRAVFLFFSNDGNLWEVWKWPWTVRFRRLFTIID